MALRKEIFDLIKNAEKPEEFLFIEKKKKEYEECFENFKKIKIGILRSFTLEPILPYLNVYFLKREIYPKIYLGGYNSINQNLLAPEMWMEGLDFLIIWFRLEEVIPEFLNNFSSLENKESYIKIIDENLKNWIERARLFHKGKIIIPNIEIPQFFPSEFFDSNDLKGLIYKIFEINEKILHIIKKYEGVYIFDLFKIQSKLGIDNWYDKRMEYIAKFPFTLKAQKEIANQLTRFINCFYKTPKKVLVLDLDNTLWGGIIGEDGIEGIKLGQDYPGIAYLEFQKRILNLYNQGVILAISSKNNYEDAINVFKNHPFMLLKEENFAVMKINWEEKEKHLKEISNLLNLGTDSFVFVDDSAFECERIRQAMPEVSIIKVPENLMELPKILDESEYFDFISITEEDKKRGKMYREEAKREELKLSSFSLEDFYNSLKMEITIGKAGEKTYQRISQLTQRTNQFNLTTKRYSVEEIMNFSKSNEYRVWWVNLKDSFGDYGIISVAIIKVEDKNWILDTFLLSCRAIQKTVETAFLSYICKKAKEERVENLIGKIFYTKKNIPSRDFFSKHNFKLISKNEIGEEWICNLKDYNLDYPKWFKVKEEEC